MLDVIICANFGVQKLRGLGNTRGQILEFPIEMAGSGHPYGGAENARLENARLENPAPNHRGGKRGTGKRGNLKVMESRRCRKCAT